MEEGRKRRKRRLEGNLEIVFSGDIKELKRIIKVFKIGDLLVC